MPRQGHRLLEIQTRQRKGKRRAAAFHQPQNGQAVGGQVFLAAQTNDHHAFGGCGAAESSQQFPGGHVSPM